MYFQLLHTRKLPLKMPHERAVYLYDMQLIYQRKQRPCVSAAPRTNLNHPRRMSPTRRFRKPLENRFVLQKVLA